MIFITLGSQKFPMDRLLVEIDRLVKIGMIEDEVYAQTGHCKYKPIWFESSEFIDREEFDRIIEYCDLLITHAGAGAIMSGLRRRKKVIAVPRTKAFGEHVDDHQKELAQALSKRGYLIMVEDMHMLADAINQARSRQFEAYVFSTNRIVSIIREFVDK